MMLERSRFNVHQFGHPIIDQQISARQPNLLLIIGCLILPAWLLTLISHLLMRWSVFVVFAANHLQDYRFIFFIFQLSLTCSVVVFLSRRYSTAIWIPQPSSWRRTFFSLLALLPLFLFHFSSIVRAIYGMRKLADFQDHARFVQAIASVHQDVWGRLAYGSSLEGVFYSSALSFAAPVLEEIIFTGFLINIIAKRYGLAVATIGTSVCFALAHMIQFGFGARLIPVCFAAITYILIRIWSGSLLLSIISHLTINAVIFLPKWLVAIVYFQQ